MPSHLLLSLALVACGSPESDRGLRLAPESEEPPVEQWLPEGADTGTELGEVVASAECRAVSGAPNGPPDAGVEVLAVDRCVRLTPEVEAEDTGSAGVGDTGTAGVVDPSETVTPQLPPPPCGYYNLVGALDLAGAPADPIVSYCDSDGDGGMRLARVLPDGQLHTWMVAPLACVADLASAQLVDGGGALLYVDPTGAGVGADAVAMRVALDEEGAPSAAGVVAGLERAPTAVQRVELGASGLILARNLDESLEVLADGAAARTLLDDDVYRMDAVGVGEEAVVVGCTFAGAMHAWRLGADGATRAQRTLAPGCDLGTRPALATDGATVVLASSTAEGGGWLQVLGAELEVEAEVWLDLDHTVPAVAWDGQRFVTVDRSGELAAWDAALRELGRWEHPMIQDASGMVDAFALHVDAETWTVATYGMDTEPASTGHVNTFYWVELSTSPAP